MIRDKVDQLDCIDQFCISEPNNKEHHDGVEDICASDQNNVKHHEGVEMMCASDPNKHTIELGDSNGNETSPESSPRYIYIYIYF